MGRPKFEALAARLTDDLESLKSTIPGMLGLEFSAFGQWHDKITLQLKSEEFVNSIETVDEIERLASGDCHVKVKIGDLSIVAVLDQDEIQKYLTAETSASTRPALTLC